MYVCGGVGGWEPLAHRCCLANESQQNWATGQGHSHPANRYGVALTLDWPAVAPPPPPLFTLTVPESVKTRGLCSICGSEGEVGV